MDSKIRRRHFAAGALVLGMITSSAARAEPTTTDKEAARTLMIEGRARRARSDLRGALTSFTNADAIMHVATTGLEVARTQASLGQLMEARETIRRLLRIPVRSDDPPPFAEARANAQTLDAEIVPRVPSIAVDLRVDAPSTDVQIELDGVRVPLAIASEAIKTNPGHHVIVVRNGEINARRETDLAEGDTQTVTITLPGPRPVAPRPMALFPSGAPPADTWPGRSPPRRSTALSPLVFVGFGAAVGGLGVGAVSGVLSLSATKEAREKCVDSRCPASAMNDLDYARATATVSNIGFAVAGAGVLLGVGALIMGGEETSSRATSPGVTPNPRVAPSARVTPFLGPTSAGFVGTF